MDRLASRDQTRRMLEALKVVLKNPGDNGEGSSLQPAPQLRELILVPSDTTLSKAGKQDLPMEPMDYGGDKVKEQAALSFAEESKERHGASLNKSQLEALTLACTQRITLIQGPPGTGKTTTAVQIVSALVQYGLVDQPMLVTADSNTAVDNLVKGIGKRGLAVVRVGRPDSIREDVKQYALDGRWKELKKAEVVCATCIGASGTTLDKTRFGTVLIDECTQAAESAALVPIARGCQQVILIGDQCQLPPTVLSDVAETENLGESLFTRLVTQGVRPVLLDTQYRMHPLIAEFACAAFYNGRLQNGVSHISRKPPESFPWPQRGMPVAFVNLERGEEKREGSSYVNQAEAEKTLWALTEVCKNNELMPEDVGLVTPYKGQVNLIKKLIRERPGLAKFRTGLEVESVDGFQGQEKEVIIFCSVRNNREGKVGFLSDWRRLNVMLTRARRGCIVIGSKSTLNSDPLWQEWLKWATARGAICGESAKGTWVPRYLVDDRDGVWTVKSIVGEDSGTTAAAAEADAAPKVVESVKEAEVLDSWEDMSDACSPVATPAHNAKAPEDFTLEGDDDDHPSSPSRAGKEGGLGLSSRAQERREAEEQDAIEELERLKAEGGRPEAQVNAMKEMAKAGERGLIGELVEGEDAVIAVDDMTEAELELYKAESGRPEAQAPEAKAPVPARIGTDDATDDLTDDAPRTSGTPVVCPKSPSRQIALAQLDLLDDMELEETSR